MIENTSLTHSKNSSKRKEYYKKNKKRIYASHRKYIEKNAEARREYQRKYWSDPARRERRRQLYREDLPKRRAYDNAQYQRTKERHRELHISRRYKISVEEYRVLLSRKLCEICGREQNVKNKVLCVDHNHKTGKIRGVLCGNCNNAIGHIHEDIALLDKIKDYLIRHATTS